MYLPPLFLVLAVEIQRITDISVSHGNCCLRKLFLSGKEMKLSNYNLITVHRVFRNIGLFSRYSALMKTTQIHRSSKAAF